MPRIRSSFRKLGKMDSCCDSLVGFLGLCCQTLRRPSHVGGEMDASMDG